MDAALPRLERAKAFYRDHEPACTVAFFVAGFLFDALAAGRIDELRGILQQALYLFLCALFTGYELRESCGTFSPPGRLKTAWRYHAAATHFMLGTLLNLYTLFYFKSASLGTSFVFLLILAGLLAVNELKPFAGSGTTLRMTLFSLCLVSYFTYLVPTLVGAIGTLPFLGTLAASSACVAALSWWLKRRLPDPRVLVPRLLAPFACVALGFSALYFARLIPPVPLSLSEIGIYHDVRRDGGRFLLTETRPRWRFWERGDQTFLARPGDKIDCFISVFSPARFKERLQLRWLRRDAAAGWEEEDAIPLDTAGGRAGGWRGFAAKTRWTPGRWRVRVETSDGRELGGLGLTVVPDETTGPRETRVLAR
ncbi:MAG TPA: DUF2914 domain-containing protein [Elusimicrobiota bacterium]|jgi:hypothetical protein|nr:DUF2914 domain-containing protein [Elusimicrobiota bacterium]